jgi:uncharacterized membrane protein
MQGINRVVHALLFVHPLHALVVHFPIALTAVGVLAIVLALWRKSKIFEQFAFFNMVLAAISVAAAGLTGYRDNVMRFGGQAPYVSTKIILALILLLLTTVTAVIRWRNPDLLWGKLSTRILYTAAYFVSFALAAVLGFIGGVIVYGW